MKEKILLATVLVTATVATDDLYSQGNTRGIEDCIPDNHTEDTNLLVFDAVIPPKDPTLSEFSQFRQKFPKI